MTPLPPPFTPRTAAEKVRIIEDLWNSREPMRVAQAYTIDCTWRSGVECLSGRAAIELLLARKWTRELDYRVMKELWAFTENRIAARVAYEYHDADDNWFRAHGNESWELNPEGLLCRRAASVNVHRIASVDRLFRWPLGVRPVDYPELSDFD
jgi:uncharacterized protein